MVAVSSLEHNPPDGMQAIVHELWCVLRPGGTLLATMSAACEDDWYHAPSRSRCYTEATLRRIFHLHRAPIELRPLRVNLGSTPQLYRTPRRVAEVVLPKR